MPESGVDSLFLYGFTAMIAHFLMSLGQTLFHRYLGHTRFGGRFFTNHIQFHHTHYSGDHVVSTHYLDNGDNNTLFFLMPVAVIVSLSYLFLRLDFLAIQLAAMSLSFCGHYYIDNQYHVAGSWLGRFSWFRRKQQLHFIHHRHGNCNFAVIDFFWDRLLGTYRRVESGGMHCGPPVQFTLYKKTRRDHRHHKSSRKFHIRQMLTLPQRTPQFTVMRAVWFKYDKESEPS